MYASRAEDRVLTFAVSGKLWQRSLVMIDSQTESLWSHILGEAMQGPLKGAELETLPSVITDWRTWRRDHPKTTVLNLSRTARKFKAEFYQRPQDFVLGFEGSPPRAFRYDKLARQKVINDSANNEPLLIVFDPATATAWAYGRTVGERELKFKMDDEGNLVDLQTGSQWNVARGSCEQGPLVGQTLPPRLSIVSYGKTWHTFHPDTEYWQVSP